MKALEKLVKIIFNILIVFLVLLVIIVAYNFIQIKMLNKKYADLFGYSFFEVTTGSMSKTIEIHDVILVQITKDVQKDDIITFIDNDEIITHRITEETETGFITKGDANNAEDKPIEREQVIGKVIKIFSNFGVWVKVFSDYKVIGSIGITIVLFGLAVSTKKDGQQEDKKSFSKFIRKRRDKKNEKSKKKEED